MLLVVLSGSSGVADGQILTHESLDGCCPAATVKRGVHDGLPSAMLLVGSVSRSLRRRHQQQGLLNLKATKVHPRRQPLSSQRCCIVLLHVIPRAGSTKLNEASVGTEQLDAWV